MAEGPNAIIKSTATQPDRVFVKRLKEMDRRLDCVFNLKTERFTITYDRAHGEPVAIIAICDKNGGFRHPDMRDIKALQEADLHRVGAKERFERAANYMENYREKKREESRQQLRDMTKDGKNQLSNAFARASGQSKGNCTFPRVTPKNKGKSLDELKNALSENTA